MKLGTHNSMTYLKPKKWYMYPFQFIARCQSKTIKEQYNLGARWFDLRVSFDKEGIPEFRHGLMKYKGNVFDALDILNNVEEPVIVRILLEVNNRTNTVVNQTRFIKFCKHIEETYKNIKFTGGQDKATWKVRYNFNNRSNLSFVENYASITTHSKLDDLWPWLYAKKHNKEAKELNKYIDILILDFIDVE